MALSADDFRRHYRSLSDEALLHLNPDELNAVARACYDEEVTQRGLAAEPDEEEPSDAEVPSSGDEPPGESEMVCIAEYDYVDEADLAKGLLEGAEIPAVIDRDATLVRLMVPPDLAEQALQLLTALPLSEEELAAQAEAAGSEDDFLAQGDMEEPDAEESAR